MQLEGKLYDYLDSDIEIPQGLHMLAGLTGFTDAGSTVAQFAEHIFTNQEHVLVAEFSNDELLDYRARRPVMYFEKDHISEYEPPLLGVYMVYDEAKEPFLYLHGYEPDFKWEAFTEAVLEIIDELGVIDFTWIHSIPFPIPHTRSVGITVSGNRHELIDAISEWKPQTQVPGNVLHLLEFRLAELDFPTAGFVFLVPHYISDSDYPQAALAAFEQFAALTGLVFPTDSLRDDASEFVDKLRGQIAENPELSRMIANLEQGFLNERAGHGKSPFVKPDAKVPTADEIASELEGYLASRRRNEAESDGN